MREIRLHGSEGGGAETNRSFLPLFLLRTGKRGLPSTFLWNVFFRPRPTPHPAGVNML